MVWSTCDECGLFLTEGSITCTCDEEYMDYCMRCQEKYNTEAETNGRRFKMCDECFGIEVAAEQYDVKAIAKEWYS